MIPWIFAVAAVVAVGGHVAPTPWKAPPVKVLTGPVVLARGKLLLPGERKPASVELWMMSGRAAPEGCAERYILCGRVALQVKSKGHPTVLTDINKLVGKDEMCFDLPLGFPASVDDLDESVLADAGYLAFSDFNHDGTPDLALGEHTCHDYTRYFLFSISASGEARRLAIDPKGVFFAFGYGLTPDMSEVKMTPDGFETTLVDRSGDSVMEITSTYHWSSSANSFSVATKAEKLTERP